MTLKQILSVVSENLPPSFDREGIASELWLTAWQRMDGNQMEDEFDQLDPPLSREIIHNRCVDEIRKRKRDVPLGEHEAPITLAGEEEISRYVESLISNSSLSRQAQKIIIEKFFLGSSMKLIAEHLMLTTPEVSKILQQTLERLRAVARETKFETQSHI